MDFLSWVTLSAGILSPPLPVKDLLLQWALLFCIISLPPTRSSSSVYRHCDITHLKKQESSLSLVLLAATVLVLCPLLGAKVPHEDAGLSHQLLTSLSYLKPRLHILSPKTFVVTSLLYVHIISVFYVYIISLFRVHIISVSCVHIIYMFCVHIASVFSHIISNLRPYVLDPAYLTKLIITFLPFFFFKICLFISVGRGAEEEGEKENPQTPYWAQSPTWGSIPGLRDHDLNQNQESDA